MEDLKKLGLTGYEANIYLALLEHGKANAKQVSINSKVPPTAVYPNLHSLVQKGLIKEFKGETNLYAAMPPKLALKSFITNRKAMIDNVTKDLLPQLEELNKKKKVSEKKEPLFLSSGLVTSQELTMQYAEKAQKFIYVIGWGFSSPKNLHKLMQKLKNAAVRNVDVRIIVTDKSSLSPEILKLYSAKKFKIKHHPTKNFSLAIYDGKECKITLKSPELQERVNMIVNDEELSQALKDYFLAKWRKAKPIL